MSVENLRQSRKGATAIFTQFTRMKDKFMDAIFCAFEGDDAKYYYSRVESKTLYKPSNIVVFNCGGKKEVYRLYQMIKSRDEYRAIKFLYFIDRDFDPILNDTNVYETKVYSVENFYTTIDVFMKILRCEFSYNDNDSEFAFLISCFKQRQIDFHEQTTLLNAWIKCQRYVSNTQQVQRLNLNNFSLNEITKTLSLDEVRLEYDLDWLNNRFSDAASINADEVAVEINELNKGNKQKTFRGKFEIDFLFDFLEAIKKEFKIKDARCQKKDGVQLNQSKKNMVSEFSQYAVTPECLVDYLEKFKLL